MMTIKEIKEKLAYRRSLLKDGYDPKNPDMKIVDGVQEEIMHAIKKDFNKYPVDFIIETLTMFGDAPNVVYDDNGYFAVSSMGYQPVVWGRKRIEGSLTVGVEKNMWKKTIRRALKYYLNDAYWNHENKIKTEFPDFKNEISPELLEEYYIEYDSWRKDFPNDELHVKHLTKDEFLNGIKTYGDWMLLKLSFGFL